MIKLLQILLIMIVIFGLNLVGCSNNSPDPITTGNPQNDIPLTEINTDLENHALLGTWTANIEIESMSSTVEETRDATHFNVLPYLPTPIITINSWDPVKEEVNVDVKIQNFFNIHGFDLRLILFTDNIGHYITDADDWTPLYDIAGGLPMNPFRAYAKDESNRIFAAYTQHTENLTIKLPGGNAAVRIAIDVSSPGNCVEPYEISNFRHDSLIDTQGATAEVSFEVSRWNPLASVSAWIQCPDVFGATIIQIPSVNNHNFEGEIVNYTGAQLGKYSATIAAKTHFSDLFLYDKVVINVVEGPGTGWVIQDNDSQVGNISVGSLGNFYTVGSEFGYLSKYDKNAQQLWSIDIRTEDSFSQFSDLNFNGFIQVAGIYQFCTTDMGYIAGSYETTNTNNWVSYDCREPEGAMGLAIIGDDYGNSVLASTYASTYGLFGIYLYSDSLLTGFDSLGNITYEKNFVNNDGDLAISDLVFCGTDSIMTTGLFMGTQVDFDPSGEQVMRMPDGMADSFLMEFTSDGLYTKDVTWGAATPGSMSFVTANELQIDEDGNIYVLGIFSGEIDFDPGPGSAIKTTEMEYWWFISKFDSNLNFINVMVLNVNNTSTPILMGSMVPDNQGNIYVVGAYQGIMDVDPGPSTHEISSEGVTDIFLLKLTDNFEFIWARSWGTGGTDYGFDIAYNPINGTIYISGSWETGTIDFDPGPGVYELESIDSGDSFLMKILPNGYWDWI